MKRFGSLMMTAAAALLLTAPAARAVDWIDTDVPKEDAICFALYTLDDGTLKMTAQLYPLEEGWDRTVKLQVEREDGWETVGVTEVSEEPYGAPQEDVKRWTAHFRVEGWDGSRSRDYRVVACDGAAEYPGTIKKDPANQETIEVAAFTGNSAFDRRMKPDIVRNVKHQDPDLLFFSGDQSYDHKNHYQAWLLFGKQFGDIIRNRPTVCIPDDHDVGQANIWGEGGKKASSAGGPDGGYFYSAQYVNSVQNAQTWHLPDPYDPEPIRRGIGVYYTALRIGPVSFAIVEDRKFKTGPEGLVETPGDRPDHVIDPDFDVSKLDVKDGRLLGDRQIAFLRDWGADWGGGVEMKAVLSQTVFANAAHRHGKYDHRLHGDLDSNGWPQSKRDRAWQVMRKAFPVHICGDQHLATVIHHGVTNWRDAGYSFCVPSIVNLYNRWWDPLKEAVRPIDGPLEHLGDYHDPLGNKITVHAYANPSEQRKNKWGGEWGKRAAGYGLIEFDTEQRTITFNCFPRGVDVTKENPDQYAGWPITVDQLDNYGREPRGWLPTINVTGMDEPVLQVYDQVYGEIVYTRRIEGSSVQPRVFRDDGPYEVRIGAQPDNMKTLGGLTATPEKNDKTLTVSFASESETEE